MQKGYSVDLKNGSQCFWRQQPETAKTSQNCKQAANPAQEAKNQPQMSTQVLGRAKPRGKNIWLRPFETQPV